MSNATKIRNAATLITCCKINNPINFNYKVLLLKRNKNMKFASSNYVFPGGAFDKSDESLKWLNVFLKSNKANQETYNKDKFIKDYFKNLFFYNINRPNVFIKNYNLDEQLPPEISFRLCAIRETFEETGLLIAYKNDDLEGLNNKGKQFSAYILDNDLIKWRKKIRDNSNEFINMFLEFNLMPDLFALHEWSNWLTPVHEKSRFDTLFFTCYLKDKPTNFELDLDENQTLEFFEPDDALNKYEQNELTFFPPQIYELTRLTRFNLIEKLAEFSLHRQEKGGVSTWQPKFVQIGEQKYGLIPGDDYYNVDDISKHHLINKNRFTITKIDKDRVKYKIESNILFNEKH